MFLMSHEPLTQEDLDVFAYYGRTMASVQQFELAMTRLARLIHPQLSEDVPFAVAWNHMKKYLRRTDTPLAKQLGEAGNTPQEMLEIVEYLLMGRENSAHEFLLTYVRETTLGTVNRAEVISTLQEAEVEFLQLRDFVNALYGAIVRGLGVGSGIKDLLLEDMREDFEQEDVRTLLSTYGATMHAVQLWELSLKGLLTYFDLPKDDDDDASFDDIWEAVERTLTTAAGPLKSRLEEQGYAPEGLHEELEIFRKHRNKMAHEFFLDYARIRRSGDPETLGAALAFLEGMEYLFLEQHAKLDALSDDKAAERGWDPNDLGGLTDEELRRITLGEDESGEDR